MYISLYIYIYIYLSNQTPSPRGPGQDPYPKHPKSVPIFIAPIGCGHAFLAKPQFACSVKGFIGDFTPNRCHHTYHMPSHVSRKFSESTHVEPGSAAQQAGQGREGTRGRPKTKTKQTNPANTAPPAWEPPPRVGREGTSWGGSRP